MYTTTPVSRAMLYPGVLVISAPVQCCMILNWPIDWPGPNGIPLSEVTATRRSVKATCTHVL